ncbi:MAG: sugar phosphate isomerase/epimerase [Firmicutes bacterium]|nr:sugar phosphate isomerase/epimerase [Bacillota bacterium]
MKDKIYLATFSENAVEVAKKYGVKLEINDICISDMLDPEKRENLLATIRKELEDCGSEEAIIHGPFTEIIPSAIDHRAVDFGLSRLEEAYEVAEALGIKRMVVHTGYIPQMYYKNWHLEHSIAFWSRFMEDKPADFQIFIENVFDDEPAMQKDLIDGLNDPRIRACLDVGHAHVMTMAEYDVYQWIEILGHRIGHFHLHNNDSSFDTHQDLTDGTLDMVKVLECIKTYCTEDVTLTIESRKCDENTKWLLQQK